MYSTIQLTLKHIQVTFQGKAKWCYRKIICKQPKSEPKYLILHRVDSLICTPRNWQSSSITFIKSQMAFDHRRLVRPGKKIRQNFFRSTSLLYKILPTSLGTCKWTFYIINFIHHTWGETVLWGTVFVIQTSDRMQCFTILQYKLLSFNIEDDWSTHGLLGKLLKKNRPCHGFRCHLDK